MIKPRGFYSSVDDAPHCFELEEKLLKRNGNETRVRWVHQFHLAIQCVEVNCVVCKLDEK